MEIRCLIYVVVNCVLYSVAKPVSLNEVIAAESQQKQLATFVHTTTSSKLEEPAAEHISLNKGLKPHLRLSKKNKKKDSIISLGKKIFPLKYRKTFQIKSPLRPQRLNLSLRSRHKRKNQSVKREISGNEKLNQKYIPLLRSLGMLFDNLLGTDSSESGEVRDRRKRVRYYTDTSETLCPCSSKSKQNSGLESESEKTADTSAEVESAEASLTTQTSPETPHSTPTRYFRRFRQNKNIPILLPRNTPSRRRDHNGLGERSRTAYNRSDQRYIPRTYGDSQHHPGNGSNESDAEDDEEDTDNDPRYSSSRIRYRGGIRRNKHTFITRDQTERSESDATDENESTLERPRGNIDQLEREDKQQIRGIKAESAELLSIPNGRTRELIPEDEVNIPKPVHTEESEKSDNEQNDAIHQQLAERSSTPAQEIKETSTRYETVEIPTIAPDNPKIDPVVFIIDGYSVTRNKNGENKLKEKAIRIQSKQRN